MKYSLLIIFFSCYATSDFAMQRSVAPLIMHTGAASLIVRTYASRNNGVENSSANKEEDIFKDVKETLGVSKTVFFSLYVGMLTYVLFKPKSAYRYPRSSSLK